MARAIARLALALAWFTFTQGVSAEESKTDELYLEIVAMDRVLFEAFNDRDLEKLKSIFAHDIEFFHDQGGMSKYDQLIENTQRLFARDNGLKRTAVPGSLEIYPIRDYGALQVGKHTFCHVENGRDDCGTFKFVHVWQKRSDGWKLTRVISYGH